MARKTVIIYTDDLTGKESDEARTHSFSVDGVQYEVDLAPESFDRLLEVLGPFMENGRKLGRGRRAAGGARQVTPVEDSSKIREWAKEHGYQVSDRGRVPSDVREAYQKAH
ncbi:Lsr2 family protein [Streptomyces sp. MP131-18]|uniref:histone-like nucleoid-structuring protein Lsr2 n=1 Tax=Streptomyces sp. MP131-18 TaxID=1857892 RepID=UPI00097C0B83|nr:Lsr2 family protein [Streptomyces sp. MP131-18]ONK13297.1 Nucleoid-associated protein Lsr2 [Streptomyces sp. MP131-18]